MNKNLSEAKVVFPNGAEFTIKGIKLTNKETGETEIIKINNEDD